jgi:holo-[acyl-carrier protein] synthase
MLTCGVDLIEVARVRRVAEKHGDHFLRRIFTPVEIDYCAARANPWPHYAARFAAKEALYKAVPPGVLPALVWVEVGVVHGEAGEPHLEFSGATVQHLSGWSFAVSLAHVREIAIAQVVGQQGG